MHSSVSDIFVKTSLQPENWDTELATKINSINLMKFREEKMYIPVYQLIMFLLRLSNCEVTDNPNSNSRTVVTRVLHQKLQSSL